MASQIEIVNLALSKLGEARITSIDDDNKPARAANARFTHLRDAEIESSAWRFAVKRTNLAATTETPAWGYSYIYERPSDDLRPLRVGGAYIDYRSIGVQYESTGYGQPDPTYQIIDGKIYSDLSAPLKYEYISQVTNTGAFPALFVQALAARLALDMAEELTQSNAKKEAASREYDGVMRQAKRINALYNPPTRKSTTGWMLARAY